MAKAKRGDIRHGNLVAGAAADNQGILIGWEGRHERTRARLFELAAQANIPREWMPAAKEPTVQLSRAVQAAAGGAYNCEQEKKKDRQVPEAREWRSRWMLVRRSTDGLPTAGGRFGEIALVVTLYTDTGEPELVFDTEDTELRDTVEREFRSRVDDALYTASDITKWIGEVVRLRLDGVRYGGNWYVPRSSRTIAETLCEVLREDGWGKNWMNPPLPIATSAQLSMGIAIALQEEVDDVMEEFLRLRKMAQDDGRKDVGETGASNMMVRLRFVGERIVGFSHLMGEENTQGCRNRIHDAMVELDGILGAHDFDKEWHAIVEGRQAKGVHDPAGDFL